MGRAEEARRSLAITVRVSRLAGTAPKRWEALLLMRITQDGIILARHMRGSSVRSTHRWETGQHWLH
jgi:hypothetical protein